MVKTFIAVALAAGAASVTKIDPTVSKPQLQLPLSSLCVGMQDGHHLRAVVVHENYRHFRWHECYYGRQAGIDRAWLNGI